WPRDWSSDVCSSDLRGLEAPDHPAPRGVERALPPVGIVDHARLEEGRAEDRGVRDLAAEPAADTGLVHVRDRILAQGIGIVLEGERGAAVEAHAGLVARAHVRVDAEARRHHPPARLEPGRALRREL